MVSTDDAIPVLPEEALAEQVRILRAERGWSQQELAQRISRYGVRWHQTTVAKIESGVRPISLNEGAALAVIFGLTGAQLIEPLKQRLENFNGTRERTRELHAQLRGLVLERDRATEQVEAASALKRRRQQDRQLAEGQRDEAEAALQAAQETAALARARLAEAQVAEDEVAGILLHRMSKLTRCSHEIEYLTRELDDLRRFGSATNDSARPLLVPIQNSERREIER